MTELFGDAADDVIPEEGFRVFIDEMAEAIRLTFRRYGSDRQLWIEQYCDEIRVITAPDPEGEAQAIVILTDEHTEVHDAQSGDAVRVGNGFNFISDYTQ